MNEINSNEIKSILKTNNPYLRTSKSVSFKLSREKLLKVIEQEYFGEVVAVGIRMLQCKTIGKTHDAISIKLIKDHHSVMADYKKGIRKIHPADVLNRFSEEEFRKFIKVFETLTSVIEPQKELSLSHLIEVCYVARSEPQAIKSLQENPNCAVNLIEFIYNPNISPKNVIARINGCAKVLAAGDCGSILRICSIALTNPKFAEDLLDLTCKVLRVIAKNTTNQK